MKTSFKKIYILILFLVCFVPSISFASQVFVSLPESAKVGESVEVFINVESEGLPINSADIILDYDQELLSFSGYKPDSSVIRVWIDSPHEKNGNIYMTGIIPGGVAGLYDPSKKNLGPITLTTLLFTPKASGIASFSFSKTEILRNDGAGTALIHSNTGGNLQISDVTTSSGEEGNTLDQEKPEPFEITFIDSVDTDVTPSMIMFEAEDKGSGIKEYKMNTGGSMWVEVKSPHPISRGIFPSNITIRAFDFYGNFQDSTIRIPGLFTMKTFWPILILLIVFCILGYRMLKYRK